MTFYLLAGDIGGTKTILQLVQVAAGQLHPVYEAQYGSSEFPDLVPMVERFLGAAQEQAGVWEKPSRACFAIAGPVVNNTSYLTNLTWNLEGDRLATSLHLEQVHLINDFEANGYGVLGLAPEDLHILQPGTRNPYGPIGVIGAGTGLGQGFLVRQEGRYQVFPSEGGHSDFAPRSELEFQLLKYLRDKHQITRVSVERVVSGQGIVAIYQFLRDRGMEQEDPAIAAQILAWERQAGLSAKTIDPAAVIAQGSLQGNPLCHRAMNLFVEAYGAEAGNLALKLLPMGGLYIAGGIAAKNLEAMTDGRFLRAFTDKGRVSRLLEAIPVAIVLNPQVGLIGAARHGAGL